MLFLRYYFWIAPHVLLAGLLVGIYRRGLLRRLPFFIVYIFLELAQFLALLTMNWLPAASENEYHWILVLGLGMSVLVKFGVIYELSNELLLSRSSLVDLWRRLFRWTAGVLLLVGVARALAKLYIGGGVGIWHLLDSRTLHFGFPLGIWKRRQHRD